jgi:hypothetical protein
MRAAIPSRTFYLLFFCKKNIKMKIYKNMLLHVALYGCHAWSLILRVEHKLRVFDNRVLKGIFGPKRDEVTGGWRKPINEEL